MQLLSLIPILILLLYLLVSIDLVYTGLCELVPEQEQLYSKINSNCSVLKLQVGSTLTNKWVVSLIEYDWLVLNFL